MEEVLAIVDKEWAQSRMSFGVRDPQGDMRLELSRISPDSNYPETNCRIAIYLNSVTAATVIHHLRETFDIE